ncbi:hypothetical protein ACIRBX_28075 [Kitasatospora sp. NPDC096147]|uniref:hypothetical protein n=1 Tax=Kitasatospora sp. NPDC096147 TaxID=3364093 RepID=UPI0038032AAA
MTAATEPFPPCPLRQVRALYVWQRSCPGDFADVTVDFEPWEPGLLLETAPEAEAPDGWSLEELSGAVAEGVREELAAQGLAPAVVVVLRRLRVHEVDSSERSFRRAGRLLVRNALAVRP